MLSVQFLHFRLGLGKWFLGSWWQCIMCSVFGIGRNILDEAPCLRNLVGGDYGGCL